MPNVIGSISGSTVRFSGEEFAKALAEENLRQPLVIDEKGRVLPFSYGMNPTLGIGQIGPDLPAAVAGYKANGWRTPPSLFSTAFDQIDRCGEGFIDWFYFLVEASVAILLCPPELSELNR